uniref:Uncharacterized protein n=1 Tax=Rhizophora mucronata TaxID=61149 RepID=A0A2P2IJM7_RHIMU
MTCHFEPLVLINICLCHSSSSFSALLDEH